MIFCAIIYSHRESCVSACARSKLCNRVSSWASSAGIGRKTRRTDHGDEGMERMSPVEAPPKFCGSDSASSTGASQVERGTVAKHPEEFHPDMLYNPRLNPPPPVFLPSPQVLLS